AAGHVGSGVAGGQRQQQDGAAVARGGQAVPGRGKVRGGGPQATAGGRLLVGVWGGAAESGGEHHVGGVEVGVQPGRALTQQARVAVAGVEEVVQQLAADALFGLGGRASGAQQQ